MRLGFSTLYCIEIRVLYFSEYEREIQRFIDEGKWAQERIPLFTL